MTAGDGVLLVGSFLSSRVGNYSVCEDLAARLRAAGTEVLTTSHRPARLPRLLDVLTTIWRRRREYAVAHVDVYSGAGFCLAEATCQTLRLVGKPYVLTLRGGNLPAFANRWPGRVSRLLAGAEAVTTPSEYLRERMQPYRQDLQLLPNPLDVSRYPFCLRTSPRAKLVWMRSFHETYNPSLVPRVVALLAREFSDVQVMMVGHDKGDGSLQRMQRIAEELGVAQRIQLAGGVPKAEVPHWLNRGDLFLNTTNVDNTPISVLEAMACGLCVVSTNAGGMPHLARHEHDALLIAPDDPQSMAAAVSRLLRDRELSARLSRNARAKVEGFDWETLLPQWTSLFQPFLCTR